MGCLDPKIKTAIPIVVQGFDKILRVELKDTKGEPVDLTGVTEITATFLKTDLTCFTVSMTGGGITLLSAAAGKFNITLLSADTALLAVSEIGGYSNIQISYTISGITSALQLVGVVQIVASLFNC